MNSRVQNVVVKSGPAYQKFTVNNIGSVPTTNEKSVNVQTLERCLTDRIDRKMGKFAETVEGRIHNSVLTAIDNIIRASIELAVRSINASSGRDAASVTANSECRTVADSLNFSGCCDKLFKNMSYSGNTVQRNPSGTLEENHDTGKM